MVSCLATNAAKSSSFVTLGSMVSSSGLVNDERFVGVQSSDRYALHQMRSTERQSEAAISALHSMSGTCHFHALIA